MIIIHYLHLLKHPTIIYIIIQENLPITDISYHLFILFTNTLLILIVTHCLFYQTILRYWYCLPIFITIHYQYFSLVIFSQKYPMIIHILTDADLNNEYIYSYINHISVQMHHIYYLILIFKGYSLAPPYSVNNWVKCYIQKKGSWRPGILYRYVDLGLDLWWCMAMIFPWGQGPHIQLPTTLLRQLWCWKLNYVYLQAIMHPTTNTVK